MHAEPGPPASQADASRSQVIPILLYHSVADDPSAWARPFAVLPDEFARHLDLVAASEATTIKISDLRAALLGERQLPHRPVLVTFDDGFADTLTVATPLLLARAMTWTVYVTTGVVGRLSPGGDRMLDWPGIAEMASAGAEIGAHSHSHPELDAVPRADMQREITLCKALLEDQLGARIESFAYPFGYSDPIVRRAVRAAGYSSACGVKNVLSSSADCQYAFSRLTVGPGTTPDQMRSWLSGLAQVGREDERVATRGWRAVRRLRSRWRTPMRWADAA
jgi:peptidoglycan/xylan/chitin deacetylase (PgdA/CDA1 family)